jgi:hypothetical protein
MNIEKKLEGDFISNDMMFFFTRDLKIWNDERSNYFFRYYDPYKLDNL